MDTGMPTIPMMPSAPLPGPASPSGPVSPMAPGAIANMDPKRREILKSLLLQHMRGQKPMPGMRQMPNPMMGPAAPPPAMQGWGGYNPQMNAPRG
jgi:hypothetical protein